MMLACSPMDSSYILRRLANWPGLTNLRSHLITIRKFSSQILMINSRTTSEKKTHSFLPNRSQLTLIWRVTSELVGKVLNHIAQYKSYSGNITRGTFFSPGQWSLMPIVLFATAHMSTCQQIFQS